MEEAVIPQVVNDQDWIDGLPLSITPAPTAFYSDLRRRATRALRDPSVSDCHESSERALRVLLQSGLVVETTPSQLSALPHYIAEKLLNYSLRHGAPCPYQFRLELPSTSVLIPTRSTFFLWHLSNLLACNIFLFSSRSKPIAFTPAAVTTCTIAFFHRINSFTSISEFLVLVPSRHLECPGPLPLPAASPPYQNFVPRASFRTTRRPSQQRTAADDSSSTAPTCKRILKRAFTEIMEEQVEALISPVMTKKVKLTRGQSVGSKLAQLKKTKKEDYVARTRLPRTTYDKAMRIVRAPPYELPETYRPSQLRSTLESQVEPLACWKASLSQFDLIWNRVKNRLEKDVSKHQTQQPGAVEPGATSTAQAGTGQQRPEPETRTCTTTVSKIIRPDLRDQMDTILDLLCAAQEQVTDIMMFLSMIVLKHTRLLAAGELRQDMGDDTLLDVKTLLPPGCDWNKDVPSIISVAPLPDDILDNEDMERFFSQDHLQYLYSRLVGAQQGNKADEETAHPLWQKGLTLVKKTSAPAPPPPLGLSHTVTEALREYTTAISNMWEGQVYKKCLRYLCRIALRLWLAPSKDKKIKEITRSAAAAEARRKQQKKPVPRKQWKRGVRRLFDDLGHVLQRRPAAWQDKAQKIIDQLSSLEEPQPSAGKLEKLDEQVAKCQQTTHSPPPADQDEYDWARFQTLLNKGARTDIDDLEKAGEGDQTSPSTPAASTKGPQESSAARLRALEGVLMMLIESQHITRHVNEGWVRKTAFKGGDAFTKEECRVVAMLANTLRPYAHQKDEGQAKGPGHVAQCVAIVRIANVVLDGTGYSQFCQKDAPIVSPASLHGLALGSVGIFEALCAREANRFDIRDARGDPLTDYADITRHLPNKRAVFAAFFDMATIDRICADHGLEFADRLTFVDRHKLHLSGTVIPHGTRRKGHPSHSMYDERTKKKRQSAKPYWRSQFLESGLTKDEVEAQAVSSLRQVRHQEALVKPLRHEVQEKQEVQDMASGRVRKGEPGAYEDLYNARRPLRTARLRLDGMEMELKRLRHVNYRYNKMAKAAEEIAESKRTNSHSNDATSTATPTMTTPTWDHRAVEDSTKYLDLTCLTNCQGENRALVFSGTDYGITKMSETIALPQAKIMAHLNRFEALRDVGCGGQHELQQIQPQQQRPQSQEHSSQIQQPPSAARKQMLKAIKMPRSFKITAKQLDQISNTRQLQHLRHQNLEKRDDVKLQYCNISTREASLHKAGSMQEIDRAYRVIAQSQSVIRGFEHSPALQKARRHQEVRSKRAWDVVGAMERAYVKEHGRDATGDDEAGTVSVADGWCQSCQVHHVPRGVEAKEFAFSRQCPKAAVQVAPVLIIGDKGTGVGTRIKGHSRRGGKKMRKVHRRNCTVAIHDEFRTSKVCAFCHGAVALARSRRLKDGNIIMRRVNGTVECTNPACISFRCGYTMKARDPHSALAIMMSGTSVLQSPARLPLGVFSRNPNTNNARPSSGSRPATHIHADARMAPH